MCIKAWNHTVNVKQIIRVISRQLSTHSLIHVFSHPLIKVSFVTCWNAATIQDAWMGLIVDRFISILTSLAAFSNFIPLLSSSEYQFMKEFLIFLLNSSLPATFSGCSSPVHDAGTNLILISLSSSLSLNESVLCAANTSNKHSAFWQM